MKFDPDGLKALFAFWKFLFGTIFLIFMSLFILMKIFGFLIGWFVFIGLAAFVILSYAVYLEGKNRK